MKNATVYQSKLKKFLPGLKRRPIAADRSEPLEPMDHLIVGILRRNASRHQALAALRALREEFVDFNEMRVAPAKDIAELLGKNMPLARLKAEVLTQALNRVLDQTSELGLGKLTELGKRELHAYLREKFALDSYTEAYMTLMVFGGHAVPVDERLLEKLKLEDLVHSESTVDVARFALEKVVSEKNAVEVYEAMAAYAEEPSKVKPSPKAKAAPVQTAAPSKSTPAASKGAKKKST